MKTVLNQLRQLTNNSPLVDSLEEYLNELRDKILTYKDNEVRTDEVIINLRLERDDWRSRHDRLEAAFTAYCGTHPQVAATAVPEPAAAAQDTTYRELNDRDIPADRLAHCRTLLRPICDYPEVIEDYIHRGRLQRRGEDLRDNVFRPMVDDRRLDLGKTTETAIAEAFAQIVKFDLNPRTHQRGDSVSSILKHLRRAKGLDN